MENIEDLRLRVEKDPSSTLFVALADEYRKAGRHDDAIRTLRAGIDRQPAYMSARVALGKIYLEKQMVGEAKEEFEKVVFAIPDNLFALKKLASIYVMLGDNEKARAQYRKVLSLNPLDEESRSALAELEKALEKSLAASAPEASPTVMIEGVQAEHLTVLEQAASETVERKMPAEETAIAEVETSGAAEVEEEASAPETSAFITAVAAQSQAQAAPGQAAWGLGGPSVGVETALFEADASIAQDNYWKALGIYKKILSVNPENKDVLQRMNELKSLLKLLGKGGALVEKKLRGFLERVKARRDEFYGRA